jgi:membrane dipeptidase
MVTFVPQFVSVACKAWDDSLQAEIAVVKVAGADTAEARRRTEAWQAAHPPPSATLAQVADHIEHVRQVAGVDHVGIGSDFDGIDFVPAGLEDVSKFPDLFAELIRRGWSDDDLKKLAGRNLLRALRGAERTAARLQRERQPSTRTIEELDGARPAS